MAREVKAGQTIYKTFADTQVKAGDDAGRLITFTISTGSVDRDNDTIDPKGWRIQDYLKNPVVLFAHDYKSLPVARAKEVRLSEGGLSAVAEFATADLNPMAETVYRMIKGGFLNATSVGMRPVRHAYDETRGGYDFLEQDLLEFSIVPVPANQDALVEIRAANIDLAPVQEWLRKSWSMYVPGQPTPDLAAAVESAAGAMVEKASTALEARVMAAVIPALATANKAAARKDSPGRQECPGPSGTAGGIGCPHDPLQPIEDCSGLPCPIRGENTHDAPPSVAASIEVLRWNRALSKAFDIDRERLAPGTTELGLVARYLDVEVKRVYQTDFSVPTLRMGAFLTALDESLVDWRTDDVRNVTAYPEGREAPPVYEALQLSSTLRRDFLVDGLRFIRSDDGQRVAWDIEPSWGGVLVTFYARRDDHERALAYLDKVKARAAQINYHKGEAFSLSGEFLPRTGEKWSDLFLTEKNLKPLTRLATRINDEGAEADKRGVILAGPPGTGKTLSMRVLMNAANSTFIWISSRDFHRFGAFGGFDYAFEVAKECAPSILFFEDVDNWIDSYTIDLLKTQMDGLVQYKGVTTVLATNFPDRLPEALLDRPGRFHDVLMLALPDEAVRDAMLSRWLPELLPDARKAAVDGTAGYSGAHIRELAKFVRVIADEERKSMAESVGLALAKLREQREIITTAQLGGSRYRPSKAVAVAVAKAREAAARRRREPAVRLDDGGVIVLRDPETVNVDPEVVAAALRDVIQEAVTKRTREAVTALTGRID